jgi:hypothetical protein
MTKKTSTAAIVIGMFIIISGCLFAAGQSLDIPSKKWGISFGNSKEFSGLRFNFRDSQVKRITGINVTLWQPHKDNKEAIITGVSLGAIPGGGTLRGLQIGILGVAAEDSLTGVSLGLLGMGAGENITGINIGGLGAGCGNNLKGLNLGGLGVGAGENVTGITIGGIGAGAGKNMMGLNIGGIGVGAGERMAGINIAGIGAGSGKELTGVTIAGVAAGSTRVRGIVVGGFAVGGQDLKGLFVAGGCVHVTINGQMTGIAVSPFNYFKGSQSGISIGIVNYAFRVKGVQIGLVNIVRSNPKYLRILPLFNSSF